jgi:Raf kinase inhibitor-like YbhB/YbcL family protein
MASDTPQSSGQFKLRSPEFDRLENIPEKYSSKGANISPPLRWSGAPRETVELALICEDPDAPFPKPFVHWLIYGLPATVSSLPAGIPTEEQIELPVLARQGKNSMQSIGYTGPNPPFWHGAHHYIFRLFALNKPIELWPGAGREDFLKAIEGAIIAETRLVGLYEKAPSEKLKGAMTWATAGAAAIAAAFGAWKLLSPGQLITDRHAHRRGET